MQFNLCLSNIFYLFQWCCCQTVLLAIQKALGYHNLVDPRRNPRHYAEQFMVVVDDIRRVDPSFEIESLLHLNDATFVATLDHDNTAAVELPHHSVVLSLQHLIREEMMVKSQPQTTPRRKKTRATLTDQPKPSATGFDAAATRQTGTHTSFENKQFEEERDLMGDSQENIPLQSL